MPTYCLSPLAEEDLEEIWLYTLRQWSAKQADRYYRDIIATIERLTTGDIRGRATGIREGYLKYPVGKHLVFFRVADTEIMVVRILHRRMDVNRHLCAQPIWPTSPKITS